MGDHDSTSGPDAVGPDVCIDLTSAALERAGLGRYQASLAEALLRLGVRVTAFVHDRRSSRLGPPLRDLRTLDHGRSLRRWRLRAAASILAGPSLDATFPDVRLFHATDHLLPKLTRARSVFTLHDMAFVHLPQYYTPRNRTYLRTMVPRFLHRADRVIVVSEHTRADAVAHYGLDPERVHVVPEGVDERFRREVEPAAIASVRRRYGLPERTVLYVGTIQPRKNLTTLLDAFAEVRRARPEVGLVVAGEPGWLTEPFFERLRTLRLGSSVVLPGRVADADLPALYAAAEVFAYPSLFEGFGLPPLEAMAAGTPVICSDATSLPEVVGDAGVLVPPLDVAGWISALERLLDDRDERRRFSQLGPARASAFTWRRAAGATLQVYRAALGQPTGVR